jgi:glycosyltransferase involved in cell wall biosynthesis
MTAPKLAILLGTFNGQRFLSEQLDSFAAQTYGNWVLWVSDDGSTDDTLRILEAYRARWPEGKLRSLDGPQRDYAANFLSLVCHAHVESDYYAWSDQDDIWEADKLERATDWLAQQPASMPALYCSRTQLVDAQNRPIGYSPLFARPPGFANALVQNVGGGNTMVFNRAARALIQEAGDSIEAVSHDWWAYLLASACGGTVFYDPYPAMRYRQHGTNLIGANASLRARLSRLGQLLRGRYRSWNDANLRALARMQHRFTSENQRILADFADARSRWLLPRLQGLVRSGVYRQTLPGKLALFIGSVMRKV